jgi:hypothetical protein
MRRNSRLAAAGLTVAAALAVGSLAFAAPVTAVAQHPGVQTDVAKKQREWSGGAAYDEDSGKWRAYITDGKQSALLPSEYDTREEAQDNAQAQADAMNGKVVDAPECQPPVLC